MRTALALSSAALVTLGAARSHACLPAACEESASAPGAGMTVPANAPALVFMQGRPPIGSTAVPGPPVLRSAAGPIAYTRDSNLLRPTSALPLGDVTLEWDEPCIVPPSDAGMEKRQVAFKVTEPSPLPTALGTASVAYTRAPVVIASSTGTCIAKLDAAVATFSLTLDPALQKYRGVARFVTSVDGAVWANSAWGRDGPLAVPAPYPNDWGAHRHDVIFAACGASPIGANDRGVALGRHTIELRAEVAGAPALSPVTFDVDLSCDVVVPDAGPDAGPDTGPVTPAAPKVSGGGCSTSRPSPPPLGLLALVGLVALSRRRHS